MALSVENNEGREDLEYLRNIQLQNETRVGRSTFIIMFFVTCNNLSQFSAPQNDNLLQNANVTKQREGYLLHSIYTIM